MATTYPNITLTNNLMNAYELSKTGQLQNAYSPLQNLSTSDVLGDFTTSELEFDRNTPIDIIVTDEYDGSQNLIINDDVHEPRLINSRMSIQENHTYLIPEHAGSHITNVYDNDHLSEDMSLLKLYNRIPTLTYNGLIEGGSFKCGSYVFYFKLSDADGNLTNTIQESGIVQVHIGPIKSKKVRMGMQDEQAQKSISFTLEGLDSGFDYVRVFYERTSTDNSGAPISLYYMIDQNFPILNNRSEIVLSGSEETISISKSDLKNEFADISAAKTQVLLHNMLFFGNTQAYAQDYHFLQQLAWKVIPRECLQTSLVGGVSGNYNLLSSQGSDIGCYYNTSNVYNYTGYWPDEYYRFGIVFIFDNNLLSNVFNIQGCDFNLFSETELTDPNAYRKIFIPEIERFEGDPEPQEDPHLNEPDDYFFDKKYMTNSKGVIKFSKAHKNKIINGVEDTLVPSVLGIQFDLQNLISGVKNKFGEPYSSVYDLFKEHHIKGLFFVRQKRIPTTLAQGIVIGLTGKDNGAIPVIKNNDDVWETMSFLSFNRMLSQEGNEVEITSEVNPRALLVPDFELNTAAYNQLFTGQEYALEKVGNVQFTKMGNDAVPRSFTPIDSIQSPVKGKVTAVPQNTTVKTDGVNYFAAMAGRPEEPYKTEDVNLKWNRTPPQDLTTSTSVIRGQWGSYVGISYDDSFAYGDIVSIKPVDAIDNPMYNELEFQKRFNDLKYYSAISPRYNYDDSLAYTCYRGDCFVSMFTHRMMSNFVDPELPTNTKIVDPGCWAKNYAVRCTAEILADTHSNLTSDSGGWYIPSPVNKKSSIVSLVFGILTGNIGTIINSSKELMSKPDRVVQTDFANEIAQAFEVYTGKKDDTEDYDDTLFTDINSLQDSVANNYIKKVNPAEQEANSTGLNLKALFKADDKWELHGLAQINRADVNAVSFGEWITFPICTSCNIAFRDVDFNNTTEEAKFYKKRSFFPLEEKDIKSKLLESQVINGACRHTCSNNNHPAYQTVPFIKQEFFNRIYWSKPNMSSNIINSFRMIFRNQYREYNKEFGAITKLETLGDQLVVIFQHGIGLLPVNRSSKTPNDETPFLASTNVLPSQVQIITPDYGSMWKDSVLKVPDKEIIFGVDTVARKIWKLGAGGLEFISDHIVSRFLNEFINLSEYDFKEYLGHINVKTHYNAFKQDVMFTYYKDLPKDIEYWITYNNQKYKHVESEADYECWQFIDNPDEKLYSPAVDGYTQVGYELDLYKYDADGDMYYKLGQRAPISRTILTWQPGITWNLCYNLVTKVFTTFYDWYPIHSCNVDNIYFSFDKEQMDTVYNKDNPEGIEVIPLTLPSGTLSYKMSKFIIDKQFTEKCEIWNLKTTLQFETVQLPTGYDYYFCIYAQSEKDGLLNITYSGGSYTLSRYSVQNGWSFYYTKISTFGASSPIIIRKSTLSTITMADAKVVRLEKGQSIQENALLFDKLYPLRNSTPNRMFLWKHGQAGLYDNEGEILPTNWYGKQREFNFEFVVNEAPTRQKIFNNLKILSNKTAPNKFEYEIVGEGYEWWPYKPVVYWANKKVEEKVFPNLYAAYIEILSKTTDVLRSTYSDFPVTDLEYRAQLSNNPYQYRKLPLLKIELTDRQGRQDRSYHKTDAWEFIKPSMNSKPQVHDYSFNTNETVIKYDKQLNEYRLHDEQLGNDMTKYGRVRGNMQYLEDMWNVEIRPLNFKWVTKSTIPEFQKKELQFNTPTSFIPAALFTQGQTYQFVIKSDGPATITITEKDNRKVEPVVFTLNNGKNTLSYTVEGDNDTELVININTEWVVKFPEIEGDNLILYYMQITRTETRHRDKFIKVRVRYSGEDLALIQQIYTIFNESLA